MAEDLQDYNCFGIKLTNYNKRFGQIGGSASAMFNMKAGFVRDRPLFFAIRAGSRTDSLLLN